MSAPNSPSRQINAVQAARLDAPVHETRDVQGSRDNADAVANDLGRNEESVHIQSLLVRHIVGWGADRSAVCVHLLSVPTSWYVVKRLFSSCSCAACLLRVAPALGVESAQRQALTRDRYCMNQP